MTPQDYERMWLLFEEAKQKQPTARDVFLEEQCSDNSELYREVVRLLARDEAMTVDFLARPALCAAALAPPAPADDPLIGRRVGSYQLQQRIGSGGMGVVYLGKRVADYEQRVAVKLIRHGLQSEEMLRRFQDERQVLAALSHPHIARLLDGGSQDGQPYLVMEYIEGQPIDDYCRTHQLRLAKRLELFRSVCAAVHHAHQNLVLHRDLKPGNILVAVDGTPKLVDFGVAKLLDSAAWGRADDATRTKGPPLTPGYASPEQIHGGKVLTTASDVYALGVVLYELLTDHRPHEAAGKSGYEFARRVCEEEPRPPRRWRPDLPRDLEAICLKCLQKDPQQRYASALALADDLNRFLENQPIKARLVGVVERGWLWSRRQPALAGLIAVAVLLLAMLAVAAPLLWLLRDERNTALDALGRARRAEAESQVRSHLAQARAYRQGGQGGRQRFGCLDEIAEAVALSPSPELRLALRNEALAAFALVDLRPARVLDLPDASAAPAFDPTFERYAWPDGQGNFHVCRTDDQRQISLLPGPGQRVAGCLFSPDGRYLGAADVDGHGKVWDLSRPGESLTLTGGVCRFSPDGRKALTRVRSAGAEMRLYDLPSGNEAQRFTVGPWGLELAWHPDGRQLAVCQRDGVQLLDLNTGQVRRTLSNREPANAVAWHPGGRFLAVGAGPIGDQSIKVYDVAADRLQSDVRVPTSWITALGFSPSGDLLFSAGHDETVRLWDPLTGRQHVALEGAEVHARTVGFSRDGRLLACTQTGTRVTLWEVARADVECDMLEPTPSVAVPRANFSPDGRLLLVETGQRLCLWDRAAGRAVAFLPVEAWAQFHPGGDSILSAGELGLLRWPVAPEPGAPGQAPGLRIGPPEFLGNPGGHRWLSLTPDGRVLAAAEWAGQCGVILDLQDRARKVRTGTHAGIDWCALSPDGRWLVTGVRWREGKAVAKVWDARTGGWECDLATGDSVPLFSPDGRWLVTSTDRREYRFWKSASWESSHAVQRQGGLSEAMAFSPDGGVLALARTRTLVQLIDPETGAELAGLEVPDADGVTSLAFNRDGTLLAAARANQVVHVWDLRRLRSRLAQLGLDWDRPPYPPAPESGTDTPRPPTPIRVAVDVGDLPKKAEANRLFGQAASQVSARQYVQAADLLRQVIRTDPTHALAHNNLAWLLLTGPKDLHDPKEALLLARKAVELAPDQPAYSSTLGVALYRNDQFAEAVPALEKSLTEGDGPDNALALFFLAMCRHRLGDDARAKDCLDRAKRCFEERRSRPATGRAEQLTEIEAEARAFIQAP